jgi:hypothetical protein
MNREELAQLAVLGEVAHKRPRGGNRSGELPLAHLHIPEGEHRFDLIEELAAAAFGYLANGEESTLLVPAPEEPSNTPWNRRPDDVIDPRARDARPNVLGIQLKDTVERSASLPILIPAGPAPERARL